jgi:hypothetical protein
MVTGVLTVLVVYAFINTQPKKWFHLFELLAGLSIMVCWVFAFMHYPGGTNVLAVTSACCTIAIIGYVIELLRKRASFSNNGITLRFIVFILVMTNFLKLQGFGKPAHEQKHVLKVTIDSTSVDKEIARVKNKFQKDSIAKKAFVPRDTIVASAKDFDLLLRTTNKPKLSSGGGDVDNNELWIKYKTGNEELLVACRQADNVDSLIADISNVELSNNNKEAYFLSEAYATSADMHAVVIATKKLKYICPANYIQVIRKGKYKDKIIVQQHRYHKGPDGGAYDAYFIVNERGKVIKSLGESNKEFGLERS